MFLSITLRTLILQSRKLQSIFKFLDSCSNFHFIFISLQSSSDIKTDCGLSCCTRIRTSLVNDISVNNYRPPTKLWKANVFTRVCLLTEGGPHMTIAHDTMDLTVQPIPPESRHGTSGPANPGHQTWDPPDPDPAPLQYIRLWTPSHSSSFSPLLVTSSGTAGPSPGPATPGHQTWDPLTLTLPPPIHQTLDP